MKKAYHLIIKGRVQGVCYRDSMRKATENLNIRGWVKNLDNGDVEAAIEGEESNLEQLISWCQEGSVSAEVRAVKKDEIKVKGFSAFNISF